MRTPETTDRSTSNPIRRALVALTASLALVAAALTGTIVTGIGIAPAQAGMVWGPLNTSGTTSNIGVNNTVNDIVVAASGDVYVGGAFTQAGGFLANYVAKWVKSNETWTSVGGGPGGTVNALALDASGNLYAGGSFGGGVYLKKWDSSSWQAVGGTDAPTDVVTDLVFDSAGNLFIAQESADYVRMLPSGSSTWQTFNTSKFDIAVNALAASGTTVYAGGNMSGSTSVADYIAVWNGTTWSDLGVPFDGQVTALATDGSGNLYAGGQFTGRMAKYNGSGWSMLGSLSSGLPTSIALSGSTVYVNADFGGSKVYAYSGNAWSPVGANFDNAVNALASDGTTLYAGGQFTTAGGATANRVARYRVVPTIDQVSPIYIDSVYASTLTIDGSDFSATPSANTVLVGTQQCTVTAATTTQITCTVPAGMGTGSFAVKVTVGGQTSSSTSVTGMVLPRVTSVDPTIGVSGTMVTVTGVDFDTYTSFYFDNTWCTGTNIIDSTTATCVVPNIPYGVRSVSARYAAVAPGSTTATYTVVTTPNVPTGVAATASGSDVSASWTASTFTASPTQSTHKNAPDAYVATAYTSPGGVSSGTCTVNHPTTTCAITNLADGDYVVKVKATKANAPASSESTPSAVVTISTSSQQGGGSSGGGSGGGSSSGGSGGSSGGGSSSGGSSAGGSSSSTSGSSSSAASSASSTSAQASTTAGSGSGSSAAGSSNASGDADVDVASKPVVAIPVAAVGFSDGSAWLSATARQVIDKTVVKRPEVKANGVRVIAYVKAGASVVERSIARMRVKTVTTYLKAKGIGVKIRKVRVAKSAQAGKPKPGTVAIAVIQAA